MRIEDLKSKIESKTIDNSPLIMLYSGNGRIICEQYINEIGLILNLPVYYIDNDSGPRENDLFNTADSLYVLNIDVLESNKYIADNHIICCNKISENIKKEYTNYIVEIPELEDWQVISYAEGVLSGISVDKIKWLCSICDNYRLMNEIDKLKLFPENQQEYILDCLVNEDNFNDLTEFNIFNLSTAIQKRDIGFIFNILKDLSALDINPIGLNNILYSNFKDITAIKLSPAALPQTLGIEPKRFNALKYYVNYYSKDKLIQILDLLSSTDYKIKLGNLPADQLIDYLITNILL